MKNKFKLGSILKDVVTGFEGVVMCVSFYTTGCVHYGLSPRKLKKEGGDPDWTWYDESRLTCAGKHVKFPGLMQQSRSGPCPTPPKG